MRFKATHENLTIHVAADEMGACLSGVIRQLVPHHTCKVYLFCEPKPPFAVQETGVTLVSAGDLPSNFLQSFRVILRPGELVFVSGHAKLTRAQWRTLAESVAADNGLKPAP